MTSPERQQANTSVCPRCGAGLRCGMVAGDAQCWCVQLPNIMPVPPTPGPLSGQAAPAAATTGGATANTLSSDLPAPETSPLAASCLCPACLKHITDERLNAA